MAATLGVLIGFDKVYHFLPGFVLSNVIAHAHLAAIGWAAMMVVGIAYRLLPMILPAAMCCASSPSTPPIRAAWRSPGRRAPGLARRADPAEERATPTIVAMHHPPLLLGIQAWDAIGLPDADRAALGEIVAGHPHVRRIVAGHMHRTALGSAGGCPVFTCPSTCIQGRLDFAHPDELSVVAEPPGFAVHTVVAGQLTTHVQPVGEW